MLVYLYKIYKGEYVKSVVIIIGILIIAVYVSPLYKSKINLGNIFGITLGAFVIICSVFFEQIKKIYTYPTGKILIILFFGLFIIFLALFFITLFKIINAIKCNAKEETTVIVLGCRVKGSVPSKALVKRCRAAAEYMKANKKAVAILSGGQGYDEDISEAECMFRLMTSYGIDRDRLIKEEKSTSTFENMLYSKQIIDTLDISENIAVATSEYHLLRAKMYAQKVGLNPYSLPAKSIPILRVPYFTREVFGIWAMKIKEALQK